MKRQTVAARRIRKLMNEFEMSGVEFADSVGVSPVTVSRWVNGRRNVQAGAVLKIASVYGLDWKEWWPELVA
ncbi:helix-turn-helix transcriptional regulator [Kistimonas scapharcae]